MFTGLKNKMFCAIVAAGVFLRFFRISDRSFWCDEFLAISLGRLGLRDMFSWVFVNDAHPPFFYSIFRFLMNFTLSEAGLRSVSAFFGAGSVLMFFFLLKKFYEKDSSLPLGLFAFSPAAILWSQMIKAYSFITFFSVASVFFFLCFCKEKKNIHLAGWVISSIVLIYLHNYGFIIIAGQVLTWLCKRKYIPVKPVLAGFLLIGASYIPYAAGPLISQIAFVRGAAHSVTNPFLRIGYTFFYFVFGETLSPLNFAIVVPGGILFTCFFLRSLFSKTENILKFFSITVIIIAAAMFFLIESTIPQTLVHLQPFFYIITAEGVHKIKNIKPRRFFSVALFLFIIPSTYFYFAQESSQYHDVSKLVPYRQVSKMVVNEGVQGEAVIFTEPRERRFSYFFPPYSPWDWYFKGELPVFEINPLYTEDLSSKLDRIRAEHIGVWLILNNGFVDTGWNYSIRDFFLKEKSAKITEWRFVENYSFLDLLGGTEPEKYYFLEVYRIRFGEAEQEQ